MDSLVRLLCACGPSHDPLSLASCECFLALWMLHVGRLDVLFVDEDRLDVLRHASARDVLQPHASTA